MSIRKFLVTAAAIAVVITSGSIYASPSSSAGLTGNDKAIQDAINELLTNNSGTSSQYSDLTDNQQTDLRKELDTGTAASTNNAVVAVAKGTNGVVSGRLVQLRTGNIAGNIGGSPNGPAGPTATDNKGYGVWAQGLNIDANQNDRNAYNGYHYDTQSGIIGFDKTIGNWAVGLSLGYADTDVSADRVDYLTDVETFQIGLYGSYFTDAYYIDGGFALGLSDIDSVRNLSGLGLNAKSDTDSNSYSYFVDGGYHFKLDKWKFTPNAGIAYTNVDTDGYTESGAGNWNQKVKAYDTDSFTGTLGVKAAYSFSSRLVGELRGSYTHEFVDDETKIKSKFNVAGSTYREFKGLKPDLDSFKIGAGLCGAINDDLAAFANYDFEIKDNFLGHTVMLGLRYSF